MARATTSAKRDVVPQIVSERRATLAAHETLPIRAALRAATHTTRPGVAATATTRLVADTATRSVGHVAPAALRRAVAHVRDALALLRPRRGSLIQARAAQGARVVIDVLATPEAREIGVDLSSVAHRARGQERDHPPRASVPRRGNEPARPGKGDRGVLRHADDLRHVRRVGVDERRRQRQRRTRHRRQPRELPAAHGVIGEIDRRRPARTGHRHDARRLQHHHQVARGEARGGTDGGAHQHRGVARGQRRRRRGIAVDDGASGGDRQRAVAPAAQTEGIRFGQGRGGAKGQHTQRGREPLLEESVLHVLHFLVRPTSALARGSR